MMFGAFLFFGIFVCGYALYALLCNWLFRVALGGIAVPKTTALIDRKRERLMTFLVFLSLALSWLGVLVLLVTYIVGLLKHFSERRKLEAGELVVPDLPIVPRMALNELMTMVFGLALFPIVVTAIIDFFVGPAVSQSKEMAMKFDEVRTIIMVSAFAVGFLIFPLCYASAYYRLDSNKIKCSRSRMAFLFIYPYMTFAMHVLLAGTLIVLPFFTLVNSLTHDQDTWVGQGWRIILLCYIAALLVMLAGIFIGRRAVRHAAAERSSQRLEQAQIVSEESA